MKAPRARTGPSIATLLLPPSSERPTRREERTRRSSRQLSVEGGLHPAFSYYNKRVEIHDSARRHGVADQDILHAIEHALAIEDAGEDPDRWLIIGPDTAGNLLEVVVMITAESNQIAIHAMPMRDKYARLLEP